MRECKMMQTGEHVVALLEAATVGCLNKGQVLGILSKVNVRFPH